MTLSQVNRSRLVEVTLGSPPPPTTRLCRLCRDSAAAQLDAIFRSTWDKLQRYNHVRCINYETCRTNISQCERVFWNGCIPPWVANSVLPPRRGEFVRLVIGFGTGGEVNLLNFTDAAATGVNWQDTGLLVQWNQLACGSYVST
jgi:hypothetical protein